MGVTLPWPHIKIKGLSVKYSPPSWYIQPCRSGPPTPHPSWVPSQGSWVGRVGWAGEVCMCVCVGLDMASVTFPPDSVAELKRFVPLISQTTCCTEASPACMRACSFSSQLLLFSLAAGIEDTLPGLLTLWGHACVSHIGARPGCQGWTDTPATLPLASLLTNTTTDLRQTQSAEIGYGLLLCLNLTWLDTHWMLREQKRFVNQF